MIWLVLREPHSTGTKCLPVSALPRCSGLVLHDSHAEVLALRGFNYWLLSELRKTIEDPGYLSRFIEQSSLEASTSSSGVPGQAPSRPFKLRSSVSIHLFTTEAPCGDASMELLMESMPPGTTEPWEHDGVDESKEILQGRGHFSMLGFVRRKPARADAEPSNSKSCTDKLAIKQFLSIISFPNDLLIEKTDNAFLRTLVVYADQYNETGYRRAFGPEGRLSKVPIHRNFFDISKLPLDFPRFAFDRAVLACATPGQQKPKVTNTTALWIRDTGDKSGGILEVLINGVKQGYKQWETRDGKASVVSRRKLWDLAVTIVEKWKQMTDEVDKLEACLTTGVSTRSIQLQEISDALAQGTYSQAKSTLLRRTSIDVKTHVTTSLGNWNQNEADKNWGRASI